MSIFVGYPLLVENRVAGVLALFARELLPSVYFETLGSLTLLIGLAIERLPAQEELP